MKVKPSLGHYDTNVLSHIIPKEACDVLLKRPNNFHHKFIYQGCFDQITFTNKGNRFVVSLSMPSQVVENPLQKLFIFYKSLSEAA